MAWVILVVSGLFEAVWATALSRIESWRDLGPILVFLAGMAVSMAGLGWAMREIPVGTAYAAWVGIGAATTLLYAVASGIEPFSWIKFGLVLVIVACVVGLKVLS